MLALTRVNPGKLVEIRNLARDVYRQTGGIKSRNTLDSAFAVQNGAAEGLLTHAIGAHDAHPSDDHAWRHVVEGLRMLARMLLTKRAGALAELSEMPMAWSGSQRQHGIIKPCPWGCTFRFPSVAPSV